MKTPCSVWVGGVAVIGIREIVVGSRGYYYVLHGGGVWIRLVFDYCSL